LKNFHLDN